LSVRLLLVAGIVLLGFLTLALLLLATDTALSVWDRLAAAPAWLRFTWIGGLATLTVLATLLAWRWLWPQRAPDGPREPPVLDESSLLEQLDESTVAGIDTSEALAELAEQRRRKSAGALYIAIYGEVSTGKSALVNALLPDARAPSDPRAGTTLELNQYRWTGDSGDEVILTDLPGFNLGDDERVLAEARRSHLVIFLTDGDITASQHEELTRLQALEKPMILALNKSDRYSQHELGVIRDRLAEQTGIERRAIVPIRTGGREEVVRLLANGQEQRESRERPADVEPLRRALQQQIDQDAALLDSLRDNAVLLLAAEQLDAARQAHREQQAQELVSRYSKRAVVGALAAVAPGSDLVIQGALATRLIQELCAVYDVSVKEVEIESFLKLAGGRIRKMSALTLAITGNALKAFPGLGTLSGGLIHAVAYGMIFDSLGRAAAQTLASRGALRPLPAAQAFEEQLNVALEKGAGQFARLAAQKMGRQDGGEASRDKTAS